MKKYIFLLACCVVWTLPTQCDWSSYFTNIKNALMGETAITISADTAKSAAIISTCLIVAYLIWSHMQQLETTNKNLWTRYTQQELGMMRLRSEHQKLQQTLKRFLRNRTPEEVEDERLLPGEIQ